MFVDASNVGHDLLPVGSLLLDHVLYVQRGGNADGFSGRAGHAEVGALVVRAQRRVRHARLAQVRVQQRAQRHAVVPRRTEISNVDVTVSSGLLLAPLEERVPLRAAVLHLQSVQRVLAFTYVPVAVAAHEALDGLLLQRQRALLVRDVGARRALCPRVRHGTKRNDAVGWQGQDSNF